MSLRPKREIRLVPPKLSASVIDSQPTSARITVDYLTPVEVEKKVQKATQGINQRIEKLVRETGQRLGPLESKAKQNDLAIKDLNTKLAAAEASVSALSSIVDKQKTEIDTLTTGLNAQTATIDSLLKLLPAAAGVVNAKAP